jgi:predicted MPP superfamily phosphohydrolase
MAFPSLLTRRRFLQLGGAALLGGAATGSYTIGIEPFLVEVVHRHLPIVGLPAELAGKRLIQVSDVHVGRAVSDDYLRRSFELVRALEPDILVLTGDYMTCYRGEQVDHALSVLEHLPHGRLATLASLGNHDYGMPPRYEKVGERIAAGLANLGAIVLRNEARSVRGLTVAGLDDFWGPNFHPNELLMSLGEGAASLVLSHNPDTADLAIWGAYRGWILSGHTHGGQCRPPFLGPPCLPVKNHRYTAGEFAVGGGRRLYINRGLGHLMHVRFNVRPEITVFALTAEA